MDLVLVRFLFVLIIAVTCYLTDPFGLPANLDAGVGALIGFAVVLFEWRLRLVSLKRLIGAAIGSVLGIFGAYLFSLGDSQQRSSRAHPELPANPGDAADGLRRPGGGGEQR